MELAGLRRTRISREARLLLTTAFLAILALWVLARLRFPQQPATVTSLQPLLTQLAPRVVLDDLAAEVASLQPRLLPSLAPYDVAALSVSTGDVPNGRTIVPALRFGSDIAIVMLGIPQSRVMPLPEAVIGSDPASGLAVVRIPVQDPTPLTFWSPENAQHSRFLIAGGISGGAISLRPVFAGVLRAIDNPVFSSPVWVGLSPADVSAGTFVFTTEGALVGLVITQEGTPAIVPADAVIAIAERLLSEEQKDAGLLGVTVQGLTPGLSKATASSSGVVVTWVDPNGPSAGKLAVLDVIESVNGSALPTVEHWRARALRLSANEVLTLRVRRPASAVSISGGKGPNVQGVPGSEDVQDVTIVASPSPQGATVSLGLTLHQSKDGAQVDKVDRGSTSGRAGLNAGDVITAVGGVQKPTPQQVFAAFGSASSERPLAVAVTRGEAHLVVALEKP